MCQVVIVIVIVVYCLLFIIGVGDVCSFAEMNPRRNGHPDVSINTKLC